jgi:hypothetical protein
MPTAAEIKRWLALVASARLAVARVTQGAKNIPGVDEYDLDRAADHLEDAFTVGLEAHGQALLKEYLADPSSTTAA